MSALIDTAEARAVRARHKPLARQSIVVLGAASGVGLAAARKAARQGAAVLLVDADEGAIKRAADEIRRAGGRAEVCAADPAEAGGAERAVDAAAHLLGGFDTWVNAATGAVEGELQDLSDDAHRRLFETTYWGLVHGSKAAVRYWKAHGRPGVLVNVGSVATDVGSPTRGAYVAAEHAVRGFTTSLRLELIGDRAPVEVTLVKAAADDSRHGPEAAADAVLAAAVHPRRQVIVGAGGVMRIMTAYHAPALFDRLAAGKRTGASVRGGGLLTVARARPITAFALAAAVVAGGAVVAALLQPETRRYVEAEAVRAGDRARKEAKRLRKRSRKLVRDVRRSAPDLQRRAARLAGALPHDLPPDLGRRIARETERARAALQDVLPRR